MSFWDRVKSSIGIHDGVDPDPTDGTPARNETRAAPFAAPKSDGSDRSVARPLERFRSFGTVDEPSPEEAVSILRQARGTTDETDTIEAALSAPMLPSSARLACAELLIERGEDQRALAVLQDDSSTDGLMMLADLLAARGDLPRAVGTIERVLARQVDAPGARERHARWRDALGVSSQRPKRSLDQVTVLNGRQGDSPFRLMREVARGGAGTVYEAEDDALARRIAYKVYHGEGADRALVEREIRMIELFAGPGILRAFDAAPSSGWIALEWIARGSLRDAIKGGNVELLTPMERWALPLSRALSRVHRLGWVHADVKPANVLFREIDEPILTDFGTATRQGEASSGGSPGYLSPERLSGERATPLDDVYGFGRIVEDVLVALGHRGADRDANARAPFWQNIVRLCVGPASHRPMDAAQLGALLGRSTA